MEITVAAATLEDTDRIRQFFVDLEDVLDGDYTHDSLGEWLEICYPHIKHDWQRLIFAYETVYENACDLTSRTLEWKPEIAQALDAWKASAGARLIAAERQRQIEIEHYTSDRDDAMKFGELALAATCYLLYETTAEFSWDRWPWDRKQFKPKNKLTNLVRAAALIAAEIDRLQRAAKED
jgi:hypothetical protein